MTFSDLEKTLDKIIHFQTRFIRGRTYRCYVFTDTPSPNFDTDQVVQHLSEFYGPNFQFVNSGNIFEQMIQREGEQFKKTILETISNGTNNFSEFAIREPSTYTVYEGLHFNRGIQSLIGKIRKQGNSLFTDIEPGERREYLLITGRCLQTVDTDRRMHSRSSVNNFVSTSGMSYGPRWKHPNDPSITEFGKIICAHAFLTTLHFIPRHKPKCLTTGRPFPVEEAKMNLPHPDHLREVYKIGESKEVSYASLLEKPVPGYFERTGERRCIFYDAHSSEAVEFHNLSGKLCRYHTKVMDVLRDQT